MKIYDTPLKRLIHKLKRTARKMLGRKDGIGQKGRHGTPLYIRITVIAYIVLAGLPLIKMEQSLRESPELRKLLGLKRPVSKTTLSRCEKTSALLSENSSSTHIGLLPSSREVPKSIAIIDTTGFKRSHASSHYEIELAVRRRCMRRLSKKRVEFKREARSSSWM